MKIFNSDQIRACDEYTIQHEPIASIDLMERAANACLKHLLRKDAVETDFIIFCGKGNNGGDGLAIARLLIKRGLPVKVFVVSHSQSSSSDFNINFERLKELKEDAVEFIEEEKDLGKVAIHSSTVIVDAVFGTGLNKKVEGIAADVIDFINKSGAYVFSIDVPSGLFIDESNDDKDAIVRSNVTLTFQFPKLSFLMPQNGAYVPWFEVLDIELSKAFINAAPSNYYYVTRSDIQTLIERRHKFSHKGDFGHALLIAGSYGKMGAAVIASKAALRSGAGLLTAHVPKKGIEILQTAIPEAMISDDPHYEIITDLPKLDKFNAIGIGPGIGTHIETENVIKKLIQYNSGCLLLDADALNILANNKTWLSFLPPDSILTPHVKEFDRLTDKHSNDFDRLKTAKQMSLKHNCIIILKGAYTQIVMPDGNVFFNSTGNPGLAKGGSGDTLTGIILGLLARGYNPPKAALIGVYVHGLAADICLKKINMESLLASDVIDKLPKAFEKLYS